MKKPDVRGKVLSVSDKGRVYECVLSRFEVARIGRQLARKVAC